MGCIDCQSHVFLDLASPSPRNHEFACRFAAPDRLLFGSDHPWIRLDDALRPLTEADIKADQREQILATNAQRRFGL